MTRSGMGIRSARVVGRDWWKNFVATLASLAVLLAIWQAVTASYRSPFFPTPLKVVQNTVRMLFSGPPERLFLSDLMVHDGLATILRMLIGYFVAAVLGVVVGVLAGLSRLVRDSTTPAVEFLRSVPPVATLPLFIILLGGDDGMRVAFVAYGVVWFILVNASRGVRSIHPTMLLMGRSVRLGWWSRLFRIVLPAASPQIFAGLRIGMSSALIFSIVSEFILATNGIGYQLLKTQERFQLLNLWSWMLLLAVLGLVLNAALEAVEARVLSWHYKLNAMVR